ncbi:unnamed protein product (mitochondrion) [Plasmodiophora brassicae]|uniref:Protein kinase domain-containing protein n=1 Tax=Plasmodiophora brassicae TaxID=37360 RepID=A0A3P3YPX7_PLABS|nr:unnamed protein product [Plasmodiophora brassicae]
MVEDRAADTLDLEMSLQLQMPGDPYYRASPTCTIVSAPSILVRVDGAINGALVTGMAVVAGDHVSSMGQVVVDVSTAPFAFPLGPLLLVKPCSAASVRVAAMNSLVRVDYEDHVRVFGRNVPRFLTRRRIRHVPAVVAYGTILRVTLGTRRVLLGLFRPPQETRQACMDRYTPGVYGSLDTVSSDRYTPGVRRRRDVVEDEFDTPSGVTICLLRRQDGSRVAVKVKRKSRRLEVDLLRAAQGPGIVRLVDAEVRDDDAGIVLVEQRLDRIDLANLSLAEMADLLIRLLRDGLDALQTMERAGIVHRDISVNNLMYSMEDRRWRLTDFDAACRVSDLVDGGDGVLYGTDGFIAPEALAPEHRYSFASDRWSLGGCALYWIHAAEDEYGRRRDVGHLFGALLGQFLVFAYRLQVGDRLLDDSELQVLRGYTIERHLPGWPRNEADGERP